MEREPFLIRGGKIAGKDHSRAGRNCQDGFAFVKFTFQSKSYWSGAVADGCGESSKSEVAGVLLPRYATGQIVSLIHQGIGIAQIGDCLYEAVVKFLASLLRQFFFQDQKERVEFLEEHLLATLLGFLVSEEEGVIFYAGDGYYSLNGVITKIDYQNLNPYLAYHLVPQETLKTERRELPAGFEIVTLAVENLQTLIMATDGFTPSLLGRVIPEALPVPLGVQLWMNKINGPRNPHPQGGIFYDDAAVVVLEREKEANNA